MTGFFSDLLRRGPTTFFGRQLEPTSPNALSDIAPAGPTQAAGPAPTSAETSDPILTYPDGRPVIDPNTYQPYPRPGKPKPLDVAANIAFGKYISPFRDSYTDPYRPDIRPGFDSRDMAMAEQFATGRSMDYQRPHGLLGAMLFGNGHNEYRNDAYRNVGNYNFGAVAAAAGYTLDEALNAAGLYNRTLGRTHKDDTQYGVKADAAVNITHGFNDFGRDLWTPKTANTPR